MTNGDRLSFIKNVFLPATLHTDKSDHPSSCQSYKTKPAHKTVTESPTEEATVAKDNDDGVDDWSPIWEFLPNTEKNPKSKVTYHTITVMLCISVGFLIFMILAIRILYKMFKFKQGNEETASRRKKMAKKHRRTNSVTSRRLSRAGSILSRISH